MGGSVSLKSRNFCRVPWVQTRLCDESSNVILLLVSLRFRRKFVTAVGTTVRVLEPLLQTAVAEDMPALWQTHWALDETVWVLDAKLVIANNAAWHC
jgi:hypothetical protein